LKTIFHDGQDVQPICDYRYDAIYQLIEASGREHIGQTAHDFNQQNRRDYDFAGLADFLAHPNDLQGSQSELERETLHIMRSKQQIALVETKTKDSSIPASTLPEILIRCQLSNHLGSASLELDDQLRSCQEKDGVDETRVI
jgi:hypothetical protein